MFVKRVRQLDVTHLLNCCVICLLQSCGLFSLLDDESKFPQGTDQSFVDKLIKNFANRSEFKTPKGQSLEFMIQHFAGQASSITLLLTLALV